ncbi:hypothetical protein Peur_052669 [Populus x canadensis]
MDKCCSSRLENEQYSELGDDGRKREDNDALIENTNKSLVSGKERMEGKSCRSRWFHRLNPKINRIAFKKEEEERLMAAHKVYAGRAGMHVRF